MSTLAAARNYLRLGWRIVPAAPSAKQCSLLGWPALVVESADLRHYFGGGENVAIIVGAPSGEVVDVDLDCDEALSLADIYLPATGAVFGRVSRPRSHRLYVAPCARFAAFADPSDGDMLLELRAGGAHQTLLPPSVADGEQRKWHGRTIAPAVFDAAALHRRCAYLAIGALLARHVSWRAAERPLPDLARLLWEADEALGRAAFHWLGALAPDETPPSRNARRGQIDHADLDIEELVAAIRNDCAWPEWNTLGMAIFAATQGSQYGLQIFDKLSQRSNKYKPHAVLERWANYRRSPPTRIGLGTLIYHARQAGWRP